MMAAWIKEDNAQPEGTLVPQLHQRENDIIKEFLSLPQASARPFMQSWSSGPATVRFFKYVVDLPEEGDVFRHLLAKLPDFYHPEFKFTSARDLFSHRLPKVRML